MTYVRGAKELDAKLQKLSNEFEGQAKQAKLERASQSLAPLVTAAVRADIGDNSMSGWTRGNPAQIRGVPLKRGAVAVTSSANGQMRVLTDGRNMGESGGMQGPGIAASGTTRRNKNGTVRKARAFKAKRWNGYTRGKGTWDDAVSKMEAEYPKLMGRELHQVMDSTFGKG